MTEHTVRRTDPEKYPSDAATHRALAEPLDPTGSRVVLRWSPDPRCVAYARLELRKALADWGLSVLEDSAVLILSELLSNAGLHARVTPEQVIETRYFRSSGALRIEVHDGSPERPQPRAAGPDASDGRGLLLVDALADAWGVAERTGPGKVVWASLSVPLVRPVEKDGS
ncbi:ATP-binding protein [Streptomyces odonnellii]|uniref:ATP-binding protein n=1 Tax=Streptomyces odonnellii TaxID=1417980 RepID=UPI00099D9ADF|nr:ATP-binding protein [Streptomyces odonnellii]